MGQISVGQPLPLTLLLAERETDRYPQAVLRDADQNLLAGSPVDLAHVASGLYQNKTIPMPDTEFVTADYFIYTDSGHKHKY